MARKIGAAWAEKGPLFGVLTIFKRALEKVNQNHYKSRHKRVNFVTVIDERACFLL